MLGGLYFWFGKFFLQSFNSKIANKQFVQKTMFRIRV